MAIPPVQYEVLLRAFPSATAEVALVCSIVDSHKENPAYTWSSSDELLSLVTGIESIFATTSGHDIDVYYLPAVEQLERLLGWARLRHTKLRSSYLDGVLRDAYVPDPNAEDSGGSDIDDIDPDTMASAPPPSDVGFLEPYPVAPDRVAIDSVASWLALIDPNTPRVVSWVRSELRIVPFKLPHLTPTEQILAKLVLFSIRDRDQGMKYWVNRLPVLGLSHGVQSLLEGFSFSLMYPDHADSVRVQGLGLPYATLLALMSLMQSASSLELRDIDQFQEQIRGLQCGSLAKQWLLEVFVPTASQRDGIAEDIHPIVLDYLSASLAEILASGVSPVVAHTAIARSAVSWQMAIERERNPDTYSAHGVRDGYNNALNTLTPAFGSVSGFLHWLQEFLIKNSWPFEPFEWIVQVLSRAVTETKNLLVTVCTVLLTSIEEFAPTTRSSALLAGTILCGLSDILDPGHRLRPKAVWAVIYRSSGSNISPADAMFMALPEMQYEPEDSYEDWVTNLRGRMAKFDAEAASKIPIAPPRRRTFLPKNTYGPQALEEHMTMLEGRVIETERERERFERNLANGGPLGIDGAWMATAERVDASLGRYTTPVESLTPGDKALIQQAASQLADLFPGMYKNIRPMTVGAVMAAMEWKYSSGAPFMEIVSKRRALLARPWFQMIRTAAEDILATGRHPGTVFGGFPKADVVKLEKALDLYGLRTITSHDVVTMIVGNVVSMERNKRPPDPSAWVLNKATRNEPTFIRFRDYLMQRDIIATGDGWRFDSTVPADIAVTASTELIRKGFENRWNSRAAETIAHSVYSAICHGLIVNYTSGSIIPKAGGGGTGSFNTSGDNVDWVKTMFMAAFSKVTQRQPREFFEVFRFGHASDDIGLSYPRESADDFHRMLSLMRSEWGVTFDFQPMDPDVMGHLHMRCIPVPEESVEMYRRLGLPTPSVSFIHDPNRLSLKRSAYRSDRASDSLDRTLDYLVARGIGHLQLVAHRPSAYHEIVQEVMADTTDKLRQWFTHVHWDIDVDANGRIIAASIGDLGLLTPRMERRYRRRGIDPAEGAKRLMVTVNKWLKANRIPSYEKIFSLWVTPRDEDSGTTGIEKRYNKVDILANASNPFTDRVKYGIIRLRQTVRSFSRALVKQSMDFPGLSPVRRFTFSTHRLEIFVWAHLYQRLGREPTTQEFSVTIRASPFASATDPIGFMWRMAEPDSALRSRVVQTASQHPDRISGIIVYYTLIYVVIDFIIGYLARTPILGTFIQLGLLLVEMGQVYALLGYLHFMGSGQASTEISNLIPRDPYAFHKQLAAGLTSVIPWSLTHVPGSFLALGFLPAAVKAMTRLTQAPRLMGNAIQKAMVAPSPEWIDIAGRIVEGHRSGELARCIKLVEAMTGSGKSTMFIAALIQQNYFTNIWLLQPTRLARDEYRNDFLQPHQYEIVDRYRNPHPAVQLKIATYGHFLVNHIHDVITGRTLVILDEFHIMSTEILLVHGILPLTQQVGVSATPNLALYRRHTGVHVVAKATRQHAVEQSMFLGDGLISGWEHAEALGLDMSRTLLIHPLEAVCTDTSTSLMATGIRAQVLSRANPIPSPVGALVATSIADVGITIDPPPYVLIDSGLVLSFTTVFHPTLELTATASVVPSSPSVMKQRMGRVGRKGAGAYIHSTIAGTGDEQPPSLNVALLLAYPDQIAIAGKNARVLTWVLPTIRPGARLPYLEFASRADLGGVRRSVTIWATVVMLLMASNTSATEALQTLRNHHQNVDLSEAVATFLRVLSEDFGPFGPCPAETELIDYLRTQPFWFQTPLGRVRSSGLAYSTRSLAAGSFRVILPMGCHISNQMLIDSLDFEA